ncbi:MAG: tRNA (guanine(37)-N(1))-methyltransferase [Candidatus Melainabacteria bacterium]|nr:tRNA (guanine(37)-N(1))-methyltransferase [Candidatus Melainabacteria bacterium]
MQIDVLSLFPDLIENYCSTSILGLAREANLYQLNTHNPRDYSKDKHKKVDDTPYGGGAGMVLMPQPFIDCLGNVTVTPDNCVMRDPQEPHLHESKLRSFGSRKPCSRTPQQHPYPESLEVIITSPSGRPLTQDLTKELSQKKQLIILCGRYEGFDQRIRDRATMEISVGDYVLTGGELPALTIIDATLRHIPGVLGDPTSLEEESHSQINYLEKLEELQVSKKELAQLLEQTGLSKEDLAKLVIKEYPQYTRPADFQDEQVPEVLLSGNHKEILLWRIKHLALQQTSQ